MADVTRCKSLTARSLTARSLTVRSSVQTCFFCFSAGEFFVHAIHHALLNAFASTLMQSIDLREICVKEHARQVGRFPVQCEAHMKEIFFTENPGQRHVPFPRAVIIDETQVGIRPQDHDVVGVKVAVHEAAGVKVYDSVRRFFSE